MSKKSDYLEFFSQAVKMLNSTGNRLAKINMVLVMLIDHLNIRNPVILIRDNVTNTYTMELAPELTQGEMNLASEKLGNFISRRQRRFYFEQMHLGKEAADIPLAPPVGAAHDSMALVSFPVMGQDKSVPLGILMGFVVDGGPVAEKAKAMKILAPDILSSANQALSDGDQE